MKFDSNILRKQLYFVSLGTLVSLLASAFGTCCILFLVFVTHSKYITYFNSANSFIVGCWTTAASANGFLVLFGQSITSANFGNLQCMPESIIFRQMFLYGPFIFFVIITMSCSYSSLNTFRICLKNFIVNLTGYICFFALCCYLTLFTFEGFCYPANYYYSKINFVTLFPELDYPWSHDLCPPCWIHVQILSSLCFLIPFYCLLNLSVNSSNIYSAFYFIFFNSIILSVQVVYNYFLPEWYTVTSDSSKLVFRVIVHMLVSEFTLASFRYFASSSKMLSSKSVFFCLLPMRFFSMYSRFLVNAVSDQVLMAVSATLVGLSEIGLRTTTYYRDKFVKKILVKIKGTVPEPEVKELVIFKCKLLLMDSMCEIMDTIILCVFFSILLQPTGLMSQRKVKKIPSLLYRQFGFKIEHYIMVDCGIQLAIEVSTNYIIYVIDVFLPGVKVSTLFNDKFFLSYAVSALFLSSVTDTYWFFSVFFMFPYKKATVDTNELWDLQNTWLYVMPNTVELVYALKWQRETFLA